MKRHITLGSKFFLPVLLVSSLLVSIFSPLPNAFAATFTVSYNANGATGGTVPTGGTYSKNTIITVQGNTGSLVKTGYTFASWNTAANGSGTTYVGGNTFTLIADTVLYAQWSILTYTVAYDANGATSGNVPTDTSSPYNHNSTVTVLGNTGSLAKIGSTFSNWNTAANGSGTAYAPTATFTITSNTVLYAQWTVTYTLTYNGNGKTGGSSPVVDPVPYASGSTVTVLGNTGGLVRTGNTFDNWNTAANGSGTQYAGGDTFTIIANVILYAQWRAGITYNANGATGGTVPVDALSPYLNGATVTVLGNTGTLIRTGYNFVNWNTAADGSGTAYAPSATFAIAANTVLYAQWSLIASYSVTYNGNGSTGGTVPVDGSSPYANGSTVTVLGNTGSLIKTGYTFVDWDTTANHSGTGYAPSDTFVIGSNTILYAHWVPVGSYTVDYNGNGSTSGIVPVDTASPYLSGATVTVLGNTGSLTKSGYNFSSWNTASNGSGTTYFSGDTFAINSNVILYARWTAVGTITVIYRPAGSTGGVAPVDLSSPYANGATVTVLGNSGALVRTGTTFDNWNTAVDGSGASYAPGNTFVITTNTLLFAQWRSTLIYNGNGSTGGTAPIDPSSPYLTPYINSPTATVLGNTGSLVKSGYVFANWNTAANGSGTTYSAGNLFIIWANTTLYAQWSPVTCSITYNGNGATSGAVPVDGSSPYANGATVTVLGNTGSLAKIGHVFSRWNTAANGSGTSYSPGNTFILTVNTVLYAQWTITYSVTYDENGATSGTAPDDASSPYANGATVTVLGNTGSLTKIDHVFSRWNTAANGSGTSYSPGNTFAITADTVLYAQWAIFVNYTLTYNANGATSGAVPVDGSSPYANGGVVVVLGNTGSLAKSGYIFANWNTAANGSGTSYAPSATFVIRSNTALYAQWTSTSPPIIVIVTPQAPIASVEKPVTQVILADATGETKVAATIEGSSGIRLAVSLTVPAGAITTAMSISIAPAMTGTEVAAGAMTIKVSATDSGGAIVSHFDKPLILNLGSVEAKGTPMFSQDGIEWTPIQKLSGTTLPAGVEEGYYIDINGSIVILTRHLTYFGMKKYQAPLGVSVKSVTLDAGKYTRVIAWGGSGNGAKGYTSLSPAVCSITENGLLKAKSAGVCTVYATKLGNGTYLATLSTPINVTISKIAQRALLVVASRDILKVDESSTLFSYGGSGIGLERFATTTPTFCTVSANGVVTGISPGICTVIVTKESDDSYMASSRPITLTVQK